MLRSEKPTGDLIYTHNLKSNMLNKKEIREIEKKRDLLLKRRILFSGDRVILAQINTCLYKYECMLKGRNFNRNFGLSEYDYE